jgi:hypothetical protein
VTVVCVGLVLAAAAPPAPVLDAVVAEVEGGIVTASDIALARALGLFGYARPPAAGAVGTAAPIRVADVERMVDVALVLGEARRLGMAAPADEVEVAWRAAAERHGGPAALDAWLVSRGIEREWARRLVRDDADWRHFVDQRFGVFAFVTPDEVAALLGPGRHPPEAEERARATLRERQTRDRLAAWLGERRRDARVRRLLADGEQVSLPFE